MLVTRKIEVLVYPVKQQIRYNTFSFKRQVQGDTNRYCMRCCTTEHQCISNVSIVPMYRWMIHSCNFDLNLLLSSTGIDRQFYTPGTVSINVFHGYQLYLYMYRWVVHSSCNFELKLSLSSIGIDRQFHTPILRTIACCTFLFFFSNYQVLVKEIGIDRKFTHPSLKNISLLYHVR